LEQLGQLRDSVAPSIAKPVLRALKWGGAPSDPALSLPLPLPALPPLPADPPPLPAGLGQSSFEEWSGYSLPAVSGSKLVYPPKSRTIAAPIVPVSPQTVAPALSALKHPTEKKDLDKPPVAGKPPQWRRMWLWSIGGAALATFALTVFWLAINYKRDSDKVAELPPIPASGVLTPRDAVYRIGEKRTVEFTVGHRQQGNEWAYLYESAPGGADLQFRVAIF